MKKALPPEELVKLIPDGATLMIGGFMGVGSPHRIIDALVSSGQKNLTIIANDTALPGIAIGKLIRSGQVVHVITSHIGLNPETQQKMISGEIKVDLCPQGSRVERIRCSGYGLGGVLVKTGFGTLAEEGKQIIEVDGEKWLLETPLHADFALIHAHQADYLGNLAYQLTSTNFNPVMAMAGKCVIAESNEILPVGMISPDHVDTPGVVVDHIVAIKISN
jgi:acetate CoA/acetoacetate CoA-transferase alpha subunit